MEMSLALLYLFASVGLCRDFNLQYMCCIVKNCRILLNDDSPRTWKKVALITVKVTSQHLSQSEEYHNKQIRMADLWGKIFASNLLNTPTIPSHSF
jgi:hypothetical protein